MNARARRALEAKFGLLGQLTLASLAMQPFMELGEGMHLALRDEHFKRWLVTYTRACQIARDLEHLQARYDHAHHR